jgi:Asp-tRNA(Asn)/Glu-tRNA(Gln) amidotransferase A subunit family amidase
MYGALNHEDEIEGGDYDYWDSSLRMESLLLDYEVGVRPSKVIEAVFDRIDAYHDVQSCVWIYLQPKECVLAAAQAIELRWPDPQDRPPLWGVPFSVKDNIDVAGIDTTTGCPALSRKAKKHATVIQRCIDAGALFVGKTNMEQLATGMTGCRSPYGTLHSVLSRTHITGGSSSGSAVSVAGQLVSFSVGSDTAGSIRLPALFNGIVGWKPTKGTVSAAGMTPACSHQDCVSFLGGGVDEVAAVWRVTHGYDKTDYFAKSQSPKPHMFPITHSYVPGHIWGAISNESNCSTPRFRFGTPPASVLSSCSSGYQELFAIAIEKLQVCGGERVYDMNWSPFAAANELLYGASFVAERLASLPKGWLEANIQNLHPVIKTIFEKVAASNVTAIDLFRDLHKQAQYTREVRNILTFEIDSEDEDLKRRRNKNEARSGEGTIEVGGRGTLTIMVVPTAPFHPTIAEVDADPIGVNTRLGCFSHFANVLDLTAISLPCGTYSAEAPATSAEDVRLSFGITLLAGSGFDEELLSVSKSIEDALLFEEMEMTTPPGRP